MTFSTRNTAQSNIFTFPRRRSAYELATYAPGPVRRWLLGGTPEGDVIILTDNLLSMGLIGPEYRLTPLGEAVRDELRRAGTVS